jgi:hypothetical protein
MEASGDKTMNGKEMYETTYKDKIVRKGSLKLGDTVYQLEYTHYPNFVKRSPYTGLPRVVGKTHVKMVGDGTSYEQEAECWVMEPFTFERGEFVSTGRVLKSMGLPTSFAKEVKV